MRSQPTQQADRPPREILLARRGRQRARIATNRRWRAPTRAAGSWRVHPVERGGDPDRTSIRDIVKPASRRLILGPRAMMSKHTILFLAANPLGANRRALDHGELDPQGAQTQRLPGSVRARDPVGGGAAQSAPRAARAQAGGGPLQRPGRPGRTGVPGRQRRRADGVDRRDRGDIRRRRGLGPAGRPERLLQRRAGRSAARARRLRRRDDRRSTTTWRGRSRSGSTERSASTSRSRRRTATATPRSAWRGWPRSTVRSFGSAAGSMPPGSSWRLTPRSSAWRCRVPTPGCGRTRRTTRTTSMVATRRSMTCSAGCGQTSARST
jgi:hypothetical protein